MNKDNENIENNNLTENLLPNQRVINVHMTHVNEGIQQVPTDYRFLFMFEPKELAKQACCGLSLKSGVQVIAIFFLFSSAASFITAFSRMNLIDLVLSAVAFLLYLVAAICIFLSTNKYDPHYASTATTLYSILYIISFLNSAITALFIFIGLFRPFETSDNFRSGIVFLAVALIVLSIHLYLIWIVYSFSAHLRLGRIQLVNGDIFKEIKDYDRINVVETPVN